MTMTDEFGAGAEGVWSGPSLELAFCLEPWDRIALGWASAVISAIRIRDTSGAVSEFARFRSWCASHAVRLVSCRLSQDQLAECSFLESLGFRFIELNYRPVLTRLAGFTIDPGLLIQTAEVGDLAEIGSASGRIQTGRFHADPQIGPAIGDRRYAAWLPNAFRNPAQTVLKVLHAGQIVAVMVVEAPALERRFWSLGLLTGPPSNGIGTRVWSAVLAQHHAEGVVEVSTSISSHNVAVHNLYAKLGFRFPAPTIVLHWCPNGRLTQPGPPGH